MATELFTMTFDAGAALKLALFSLSDGKVFDFADNTFKLLSAPPTTPFVSATELADLAGAGKSVYKTSVDLALINSTSTSKPFLVDWFTDTGLTTRVSQSLQVTVTSSALGTGDPSGSAIIPELTEPVDTSHATRDQLLMALAMESLNQATSDKNGNVTNHNAAGTAVWKHPATTDGATLTKGKGVTP